MLFRQDVPAEYLPLRQRGERGGIIAFDHPLQAEPTDSSAAQMFLRMDGFQIRSEQEAQP